MKRGTIRSATCWSALLGLTVLAGCTTGKGDPVPDAAELTWPGEVWPTSAPEDQGIDPSALDSLVADIESGDYGLVDAFLLIRNGFVVANHRFTHDYAAIGMEYDTTRHQYNYDHPEWHPYLRDTDLHTLQSVTKSVTSAALGIAISGWALDLFGYVPNVAQTETARLGIRLFFGLVPSIAIILSLPLLIWYPITRNTHAEVREELRGTEATALPED